MSIEVRTTEPDEYRAAAEAMALPLMGPPISDERWEKSRPSWDEMASYSAWDGEQCVGHAGQFFVETTVPGGAALPTAAVSRVGVLPTYRRRGLARRLIEACIRDADERGLALMSLRASQATIYERFGFGLAGEFASATVDPLLVRPVRGADPTGSFRLLGRDEVVEVVGELYGRFGRRRVGAVTRPPSWTQRYLNDVTEGSKRSLVAVHTNADGDDDGYVHYTVEWHEDHPDFPQGKGHVDDLFAATDEVELALWQYLCEVDLVTRWHTDERPLDDLIRFAANDPRGYRVRSVDDEQWVRLVDVDIALAGRTYAPIERGVRVQVTDPLVPGNDGTWEIDGGGATRTSEEPDLTATLAGLSAAYLGGTSWAAVVATGRAVAHTDGAAARADELFRVTPLPCCGSFF